MTSITYTDTRPDSKAYHALFETTGWNSTYLVNAADLERALGHSHFIVAAYEETKLVGVGRVVSDGVLYAMIYDMIVAPSHQGQGIGTMILSRLIDKCHAAGIREIQLFSAKGKTLFYQKRGFIKRPADAPGMRLEKD